MFILVLHIQEVILKSRLIFKELVMKFTEEEICEILHAVLFVLGRQQFFYHPREMLHLQDVLLGGDIVRSVARIQRSAELGDDAAAVHVRTYPMHSHAGLGLTGIFDSLVDMVAVHPYPAELRQEGGMEVDHPVVIFIDEEIRDDKEETGEDYEIDGKLRQQREDDFGVVETRLPDHPYRHSEALRLLYRADSGFVADNQNWTGD